ncbi:MAG: aminotransferase class I/II-fold pyridoxal phosphate-dependent enzyme [Bacteroidetes bacterium]|nr:aminotransferase class I/II-fold pyridoxal phosphate-dependent enzyme [Bacteroidota bacterium]
MKRIVDLRSDTVTKPSLEMRKAIYDAEVGDDVYKEDPTANELEKYVAELLGKEAALFVPSGVMGNQICLNVLTNPGDEVICEKDAHIFYYESGSPAALSGISLFLLEGERGIFKPEQIKPLIRPRDAYYMPRTKAIAIENTHNRAGGTIYPLDNIKAIRLLAEENKLYTHLDGARLWNASVATGVPPAEYARYFDTVSVCLSKGLGAPIGSVIAGSKELMKEAFRVRKGWGGGMRQVGIIAAAALYAVKNNIDRLKEDHEKAKSLAEFISKSENLTVDLETVETNILMFGIKNMSSEDAISKCKDNGILLNTGGINTLRIVTHMDVSFEDIEYTKNVFEKIFS